MLTSAGSSEGTLALNDASNLGKKNGPRSNSPLATIYFNVVVVKMSYTKSYETKIMIRKVMPKTKLRRTPLSVRIAGIGTRLPRIAVAKP